MIWAALLAEASVSVVIGVGIFRRAAAARNRVYCQ